MRYVLIASGVFLIMAAMSPYASAAKPDQGFQIINNNVSNNYFGSPGFYPDYAYGYGPDRDYRYRESGGHNAAVRRIMATHSRFRQYNHPRSNFNGPPSYYDWRGW